MAKVGELLHSHFSLYEADGQTKRSGAAGDVTTTLLRAVTVAAEAVAVAELAGTDEYRASFTPLSTGTYTVIIRDTVRGVDYVESFSVFDNDVDDVAAAVAGLAVAATPAVVSVMGVDDLRTQAAWTPTVVILRRSTMSPADPDGNALALIEVLSGDGADVLQEVDGADATRTGVGRFTVDLEALASAGTVYLRVTFNFGGVEVVDVARLAALPALGAAEDLSGGSTVLARVCTYPSSVRRAKFDVEAMSDEELWQLIRETSAEVEAIAGGVLFNAEYGAYECTGRAQRVAYHPLQHPFCYVEKVELDGDRTDHGRDGLYRCTYEPTGLELLLPELWVLRSGLVESVRRSFPAGPNNVLVTGAIGVVEPYRRAATVSTTELAAASNSLDVEDATGFTARAVVDIISDASAARVILTRVDATLNRLFFDPLGGDFSAIEVGAVVRTFGHVPMAVEMVTNYLLGQRLRELAANEAGDEYVDPGRIKAERTDNYQIEFHAGADGGTLTGSPRYDRLLAPYMRAADVRIP
jgi:hypothetical protein